MIYYLGKSLLYRDSQPLHVESREGNGTIKLEALEGTIFKAIVEICISDSDSTSSLLVRLVELGWPGYGDGRHKLATCVAEIRKKIETITSEAIIAYKTYRLACSVKLEYDRAQPVVVEDGKIIGVGPYPGTVSYGQEFADFFFGRKVNELDLKKLIDSPRPTAVLLCGPSGAGKTSLLNVGLRKRLPKEEYCYTGPIDVGSNQTTNDNGPSHPLLCQVLTRLGSNGTTFPDEDISENDLVRLIEAKIQAAFPRPCVLCFDQIEVFFRHNEFSEPLRQLLESVHKLKRFLDEKKSSKPKNWLTVIFSTRKEFALNMEKHLTDVFQRDWEKSELWNLTRDQAFDCLIEPCSKLRVGFKDDLAQNLLDALAGPQNAVIKPMDIQRVGRRLWQGTAGLTQPGEAPCSCFDMPTLRLLLQNEHISPDEATDSEIARQFIKKTLSEALEKSISSAANRLGVKDEYITLCLVREFVDIDNNRKRVKTNKDKAFVGKVPVGVVAELQSEGLIQLSGEDKYELSHDALALEIANRGQASEWAFAMRGFDLEMSREELNFTQTALMMRLESVRASQWPFSGNEAGYALRYCLGIRGDDGERLTSIKVEEWAKLAGGHSGHESLAVFPKEKDAEAPPKRLARILREGLLSDREVVQADVIDLLTVPAIRSILKSELSGLTDVLERLCLSRESGLQARACEEMLADDHENGVKRISEKQYSKQAGDARLALALILNAAGRPGAVLDSWKRTWNTFSNWHRAQILLRLAGWRLADSYAASLFTLGVVVIFTALGATLPYVLLGSYWGGTLIAPPRATVMMAAVQGMFGGLVWGSCVSFCLLVYFRIWRGGWIERGRSEAWRAFLVSSLGGAIGGWLNAEVILNVFQLETLMRAGWVNAITTDRRHEFWSVTHHGWAVVAFGAALGGVGWSLATILAEGKWVDPKNLSRDGLWQALRRIAKAILGKSLINVTCLGLAVGLAAILVRPGDGVCEPSVHTKHGSERGHVRADAGIFPQGCAAAPSTNGQSAANTGPSTTLVSIQYIQPNQYWRAAGLAAIMFSGGYFLEAGFLFSLLAIQFKLDILRKMRNSQLLRVSVAPVP